MDLCVEWCCLQDSHWSCCSLAFLKLACWSLSLHETPSGVIIALNSDWILKDALINSRPIWRVIDVCHLLATNGNVFRNVSRFHCWALDWGDYCNCAVSAFFWFVQIPERLKPNKNKEQEYVCVLHFLTRHIVTKLIENIAFIDLK